MIFTTSSINKIGILMLDLENRRLLVRYFLALYKQDNGGGVFY
jgi:hypothetical protein